MLQNQCSRSHATHLAGRSWTGPNASNSSQQAEPNNSSVQSHAVNFSRIFQRPASRPGPTGWSPALHGSPTCILRRGEGANLDSSNYDPGAPRPTGPRQAERGHCPLKRPPRIPGNRTGSEPTTRAPRGGAAEGAGDEGGTESQPQDRPAWQTDQPAAAAEAAPMTINLLSSPDV